MNFEQPLQDIPPAFDSLSPAGATADHWKPLLKRFLACNPFYLTSAASLLYGIYRASVDVPFLTERVSQLIFNSVSLQVYEALLIGTAIFLASRRIWYDSALLVFLENLLVVVPFILVSDVAHVGVRAAWWLCAGACLFACGRFWSLKRFAPGFNLPSRLMIMGVFLLALNAGLPLWFRSAHEAGPVRLGMMSFDLWMIILPLLMGLANTLPKASRWGGRAIERSWLPIGFFIIWIAATGTHLWCIGYVYDLLWSSQMMSPAIWTLAWTLFNRRTDFLPAPNESLKKALFILPCGTPLLAIFGENSDLFFILAMLNAAAYSIALLSDRSHSCALHLALISLAVAFAGMPEIMGRMVWTPFDRETCLWTVGASYFAILTLFSRIPMTALVGAIATVIAMRNGLGDSDFSRSCMVQSAMVFLLLHSLGWKEERWSPAPLLRWGAAIVWVIHSFAWMHSDPLAAGRVSASFAAGVLAVYGLVRWITGRWGPKVVPLSALAILLSLPLHRTAVKVKHLPLALVAMIGSYLLFAVGTWFALIKGRWSHDPKENDSPSQTQR